MEEIKAFNIRVPKELWVFLKKQSIEQEKTMNAIIQTVLEKYKKGFDKKS